MGALLLLLDIVAQQGEAISVRAYGDRHKVGGMFFNAVICLFAMIFFFVTDKGGLCFPKELIAYGLVSALMFATGFYTLFVALKHGSFVTTKLVCSFSVVMAIIYGILFLKEPASIFTYTAIALFLVSVFMMNYSKSDSAEKKPLSVIWIVSVALMAISNGFISIISREQQLYFDSAYDTEFMILSFGGASLSLFIMGFIKERSSFKYIMKHSTLYGIIAGAFNGAKNFIGLVMYLYIPISVAVPLKMGLGFIVTFFISVLLYKERFTKLQVCGVIIGTLSIVMFNL